MQCRLKQQAVIKFMVTQDKSPIQCWRDLLAVYGNRGLGKTRVHHWHKLFKLIGVTTPTADKPHMGRMKSAHVQKNIDLICDLLEDDRRKTVCELVIQSGLSHGTVYCIIHKDLNFSRICAKFIPRLLTPLQMDHCVTLAAENLALLDSGGRIFMERIISGDETWLYCFDPQTK